MANYAALVAKWATLTPGTTQQKLDQINALTVAGTAVPAVIPPNKIVNAIVPADLIALATPQLLALLIILWGSTGGVDGSPGTTTREAFKLIFVGKAATLAALNALVLPFDTPQVPWWQAPVPAGGGGLSSPVNNNDLLAAGLS